MITTRLILAALCICTFGRLQGAFVQDSRAYVLSGKSMYVFDVKNPLEPALLGSIGFGYPAQDVVVEGKTAYVADGKGGLCLVDVTRPESPRLAGQAATDFALAVKVLDGYAYVADRQGGLAVIGVKNPKKPRLVGRCQSPGFAWDVSVKPGLAAIADCEFGLRFIDISDPSKPVEVGHWDEYDRTHEPQEMMWALGVCLKGNYAYGAFQRGGLNIVDISDPKKPGLAGHANLGFTQAQDVAVQGDTAFVMVFGNVSAVDVSKPTDPKVIGRFDTDDNAVNIFPWGGYLFSQAGILDISNAARMQMVSLFEGLILREKQTQSY